MTLTDILTAIVISVVPILLTKVIYRRIALGMISEDLAASSGVNIARANLLYLLLISRCGGGSKNSGDSACGFSRGSPGSGCKDCEH
nr:metal ABC transporter permease [Candidatus Njordarchaeota archaeon]